MKTSGFAEFEVMVEPPGRDIRKAVEYPEPEFARIEKAMDFGVILIVVKFKAVGMDVSTSEGVERKEH